MSTEHNSEKEKKPYRSHAIDAGDVNNAALG